MNSTLNYLDGLIQDMNLKDRVLEAMTEADLSKTAFARATGRTPGAITQLLNGSTKSLKAETAQNIEKATGYRASWLVSGKGEKLTNLSDNQANGNARTSETIGCKKYSSEALLLAAWLDDIPHEETRRKALKACIQIVLDADLPAPHPPTLDTGPSESS